MSPNPSHHPIILFNGVCNLCNQWVQFVIKRDSRALFRFASLQSDTAGTLLSQHNYEHPPLQSAILLMNRNLYTESTAILHIVRRLRGPIQLMACFRVVPHSFETHSIVSSHVIGISGLENKRHACCQPLKLKCDFWTKHTNGGKQCVYQQKRNFV